MARMDAPRNGRPRLVLLIDADPETRHVVAPLLSSSGLELVQARDSVAGLEILQRLPERFRLVIVNLEMPGLSGAVVLWTLALFRPDLPVICLTGAETVAAGAPSVRCVGKPLQRDVLREQVTEALERGAPPAMDVAGIQPDAVERARRSFARSRSLLDAAHEVARGIAGETSNGW